MICHCRCNVIYVSASLTRVLIVPVKTLKQYTFDFTRVNFTTGGGDRTGSMVQTIKESLHLLTALRG